LGIKEGSAFMTLPPMAILIGAGGAPQAQTTSQVPPSKKTGLVARLLMQRFSPPPDKVITLATVLKVANGRSEHEAE
jgi:hypothetical protein